MGFFGDLFSISVEVPPRKKLKVRFPLFPKRAPRIVVQEKDKNGKWRVCKDGKVKKAQAAAVPPMAENSPAANVPAVAPDEGGQVDNTSRKTQVVAAASKYIDASTQTDKALEPCYHCAHNMPPPEKSKKEKQNESIKNKQNNAKQQNQPLPQKDQNQQQQSQEAKRVAFRELLRQTPKYTGLPAEVGEPSDNARFPPKQQEKPISGHGDHFPQQKHQPPPEAVQHKGPQQMNFPPPQQTSQEWLAGVKARTQPAPVSAFNAPNWKMEQALWAARNADEDYVRRYLQEHGNKDHGELMKWLERREADRMHQLVAPPSWTEPGVPFSARGPKSKFEQKLAPDPGAQTVQNVSNHRAPLQHIDDNSAHGHWDKRAAVRLIEDREAARKANQETSLAWLAEQAALERADAERAAYWQAEQAEARRREKMLSLYRVDGRLPPRNTYQSRDRRHSHRAPRQNSSIEYSNSRARSHTQSPQRGRKHKKEKSKHDDEDDAAFAKWPIEAQDNRNDVVGDWQTKVGNFRPPTVQACPSHNGHSDRIQNVQPEPVW